MSVEANMALNLDLRELLSTLSTKLRVLSLAQILRTWPTVTRRLATLEREGFIISFVAVLHPELVLDRPIVRWAQGDEAPDLSKASYMLRNRWCLPPVPMKCYIASGSTGRMFGGWGGRYPRESEETHDIHLAAVFLRLKSSAPDIAATWVSEAQIKSERKQRRGKVPDAIVLKRRVIEFGGAYKKQKLLGFHKFCEASNFDYEVW